MPFTIEENCEETNIVILDDTGDDCDIDIIISNTGEYKGFVSIRQYNEISEQYDIVTMSPKMFEELQKSFDSPVGFHGLEWK